MKKMKMIQLAVMILRCRMAVVHKYQADIRIVTNKQNLFVVDVRLFYVNERQLNDSSLCV